MVARGKEVASPYMQKISGSIPDTNLYCASGPQGVLLCKWGGGGNDQSIGSIVSDASVRI